MGLFGKGKSGGLMNVIRCDEEEYLIWKWRPDGQDANSTSRENSIRYGSSLRVKDGEVAIFLYHQKNGTIEDFIEGPYDDTIKTANFPVLSSIVGLAFGGGSPFQAEVYFINLASNNQLRFAVPYLDVFRKQIQAALSKYIKGVVMNVPKAMGIPLVQMETQILEINERIEGYLKPRIENDFGVNMKGLDIGAIEINKESPYYNEIRVLTAGNTARTMQTQADINIQNMKDMQSINKENMAETLRIQREEMQRAQRLQSENANIGAFSVEKQAAVLKAGAQNLGQMGSMNLSGGSGGQGGGSLNPAGMRTGMMMGGAVGQQMAGMMNNMGQQMQQGMNQQTQTPPQMPIVNYYVAVNGQQFGPFNMQQLQQSVQNGQLTKQTYVWKQGMANWDLAGNVQELASLFAPPIPNGMPTPPPMP